MIKQSNFVVVALLGLLVAQQALGQSYYNYWRPHTCALGSYPQCSFTSDQQYTTSWDWWTSTNQPETTQPATTQQPQVCVECPRGMSTSSGSNTYNYWYANNFYGCQVCQPGYYANRTGADTCDECPAGFSCVDPTQDPQPCPAGFYCPPTTYSATSTSWYEIGVPRPCPSGTYASKKGSSECLSCQAGWDCTDPTTPVKCPIGTETESSNNCALWPNLRCKPCAQGFVATKEGTALCTRCPEGYFCPDPTQMIRCPAGTFRSWNREALIYPYQKASSSASPTAGMYSNDAADKCFRCPFGSYQTAEGQRSCKVCPKGSYCPVPHVAPIKCPTGTYSNSEAGQQVCYPCPDGTYANTTGNTKCKLCPPGYYCNDPNIGPQLCPLGTFSNSTVGQMVCAQCPPNTYTDKVGSSECLKCPDGMCCDDPTSLPTACANSFTSTPFYTSSTTDDWIFVTE